MQIFNLVQHGVAHCGGSWRLTDTYRVLRLKGGDRNSNRMLRCFVLVPSIFDL